MTNDPRNALLDFATGDSHTGFRLQRLEVYNWGTFHQRVWHLTPDGETSLLTGDIGSGKSTLVDAITTLLVPAQRITYNKAAGAEQRERSLRSYVLGYYKTERGDGALAAKPVALRDFNSYSVILAQFHHAGYDQHVTLAQVFWLRDGQGQPARSYVVADRPLTITEDFANFGSDLNALRKRLRRMPQAELFDHFPPYGAAFRRRFGLDSEQALELFNQTVSMKSVGNLTEFVRGHMLEAFAVEERIGALIRHFEDLDRAHQAVLKAKAQIDALQPLADNLDRHAEATGQARELTACREALQPWFAGIKAQLLEQRRKKLERELERLTSRIEALESDHARNQARRDELKQAIADNGGDRLERLKRQIDELGEQADERRRRAKEYQALAQRLELEPLGDEAVFLDNRRRLEQALEALEDRKAEAQNAVTESAMAFRDGRERVDGIERELDSLRRRRSNIPAAMLALRERLCTSTGLPPGSLPFAGELIQVRDEERDWEGAIERLLHNFGLSLLVPDTHYRQVAEWVDRTHLRGRLVYYRVREPKSTTLPELPPDSLVRKLAVKPDSDFYAWLEQELARRFDYACCRDLAQFRREQRAITRSGQVKARGERHEKDDRHAIDDRTRYVLGWSNAAKIAALERQQHDLQQLLQRLANDLSRAQDEQKRLETHGTLLNRLDVYRHFQELDWHTPTRQIQHLEEERRALEAASDTLRLLQEQLADLDTALKEQDTRLTELRDERTATRVKRDQARDTQAEAEALVERTDARVRESVFPRLDALRPEALPDRRLTVESCDNAEREMRTWLQGRIDAEEKRLKRLGERIIDAMRSYQIRWPLETREVDVSIEAGDDYRGILQQLVGDDLPRFEADFRKLLKENTIREVAGFQAKLNQERELIRERIDTINRSLHAIDYNPNRYIRLQAKPTPDPEVRDFRESLRACTEGALTGSESEEYSEAKFLQVKAIIERLRGREGQTELDKRWTRKVTDVRNWFVFSASERWREDDAEHEHYTDAGGKSGGQKEKLAYTVLAASLAYQFGLEAGEQRSRSFRFVVIDEAFGRGSDESARYGLELFQRLNLQLLIVTPLQKIHIIEPFVASVGYVHNDGGQHSLLRNLSIEEYRTERAARSMISVS
ncbi:ATP-dependent exonuclease SbcCD, C subunit-like protein [Billgrantia azerbaijanica]|nr:ATP-dependent exonuclease SbcCD, C subunit-like protein [Halomonas azerbaijanica]